MGFGELSAIVPPATAAVLIVVYRMLSNDISSLKSCIDALALEVKQLRQDIATVSYTHLTLPTRMPV